jgi:hypothetical protein
MEALIQIIQYFEIDLILCYNRLYNIIIGERSAGKSYSCKKKVIKKFLEKGDEFIYLRRYEEELEDTQQSYFDDIIRDKVFPNHDIIYQGGNYYIDGRVFGYCMALSKAQRYKSSSYPKVKYIIFEEFLIENEQINHYLKNEVDVFNGFYLTIDRYRDTTVVFFLGNATSIVNPYTTYWNLYMPYNSNILLPKDKSILLYLEFNENRAEQRKKTRYGGLIKDSSYAKYAIENKFMKDSKEFIRKKSAGARYYFSIRYMGDLHGVWIDWNEGKLYVSPDVDPSCRIIYTLKHEDHTENTMLIQSLNKSQRFKQFIDCYKVGNVYFENLKVKNIIYDVIKMCVR